MSVVFNASSDRHRRTSGTMPVTTSDFTACGWFYFAADQNNYTTLFAMNDTTGTPAADGWFLQTQSDGTTLAIWDQDGNAWYSNNVGTLSVGNWYHLAVRKNSTNLRGSFRLISSGSYTTAACPNPPADTFTVANIEVGNDGYPDPANGSFVNWKIYQADLTDAELIMESLRFTPVRWENLWAWYPMLNTGGRDYGPNGYHFNVSTGLDVGNNPPITWGARPKLYAVVVSGSEENASVAPAVVSLTLPAVTAAYAEVDNASVNPLAVAITPVAPTPAYTQINSASVSPVAVSVTLPSVTAAYVQVETASAAPVIVTTTLTATTATYTEVDSAEVSPILISLTLPAVIASYVQIETASVSPVPLTITLPDVTATSAATSTAAVAPVPISLTIPQVAATYAEVDNASVAPVPVLLTIPEVTATAAQTYNASVSPVVVSLAIPEVTAQGVRIESASVAPLEVSVSIPAITATYIQIENASVSPVALVIALVSITANNGVVLNFKNTSVVFSTSRTVTITDYNRGVEFSTKRTVDIE